MAHIDDTTTQRANARYIRATMDADMLERGHEQDLARRWRDKKDQKALHELVNAYGRLVVAMATRFRAYGLPLGDLIQEGNIGLMQAAERFDPERDVRFSTYAGWWIRAAIQDYVLRNWSIVRLGSTAAQKALFFNLRRLKAKLGDQAEIATALKVKPSEVAAMDARLSGHDQSLNVMVGESETTEWQDMLADTRPTPEDVVIGMKDAEARSKWLGEALGALDEREKSIIRQRHLNDNAVVTLDDLGRQLGISKERVRQLEQRAMDKMRDTIGHHAGEWMGV